MESADEAVETVGRLARRFGLSRSTLLYYDRIGLLSPSGRSAAGYRLYSEEDAERLAAIHEEMSALRHQQRVVLRLLRTGGAELRERSLDKAGWTALLRATGLDDDDMWRWHAEFERMAPEAHRELLATLGIGDEEIESIRRRSRERSGTG